jgi:hypothetical protein
MEILKFENSSRPVRKKSSSSKAILGLAGIAAVALLGSTLAANISLNGAEAVEFGQGVAQTTACDTNDGITVTPAAAFVNATSGGSFNFATVALTGIDADCEDKIFTLKAYGDSSATPLTIATVSSASYTQATFTFEGTPTTSPGITVTGVDADGGDDEGTITLGFDGTQATSGAVYKLTLESQ